MNGTKTLTMLVAAVVLIGGLAAVGAAAPADQGPANASDAHADRDSEAAGPGPADDGNASDTRVGPSGGLPEQVPDHVTQIHETIESALNGSIDTLGDALGSLRGSEAAGSSASGAQDEHAVPA